MEFDSLGERSAEKDLLVTTRSHLHTPAQDVEGLVTTNSPSQDFFYLENQIPSRYVTPTYGRFKLFSILQEWSPHYYKS